MKTKIFNTASFVFAILFSLNAAAAPTADWAALSTSSSITTQTLDPDITISGGTINDLTSGDFNCDGFDDLVVVTGAGRYGKVYIHLGGASYSFPTDMTDADYVITGSNSSQRLSYSPVRISDVDGDSCPELVVNADKSGSGAAYETLFLFNSTTISGWATDGVADDAYTQAYADSEISMGVSNSNNYNYVHNVGAINGAADGEYLAVGSQYTMLHYLLPVSALVAGSSIGTVEANSDYYIGSAGAEDAAVGGDVDGDGVTDLIVGNSENSSDGMVVIFGPISDSTSTFNAAGYYETSAAPVDDNIIVWGTGGVLGSTVNVVDVDGNGIDEILVSDSSYDSNKGVYYLISGLNNLKGVTNEVYVDITSGSYNFGSSQIDVTSYVGDATGGYVGGANNAVVADIDGDGYEDVFLGGQNYSSTTGAKGRGYVLYNRHIAAEVSGTTTFEDEFGTAVTLSDTSRADAYVEGSNTSDYLATKVVAGDFDGDGDDAVVTYSSGANSTYGQLNVIEFPDDVDGDGIDAKDGDCNDADNSVGLGSTWYLDADADGFGALGTSTVACLQPVGYVANANDCDDLDAATTESRWWWDEDADSFGGSAHSESSCTMPTTSHGAGTWVSNNDDCDDADAAVNPDTVWYADADGDGYGDLATSQVVCVQPANYVINSGDCDDADAAVMPDTAWYADVDGDGFGDAATTQLACTEPANYVSDATDCNDADADINPDTVWYQDADGDTFGNASVTLTSCAQPADYVLDATDFDDTSAAVYPGAREDCTDGLDNDGNGFIDTADTAVCSTDDADADGFSSVDGDCDDSNASVNPDALEIGDAIDNDCDGRSDENLATVGISAASLSALSTDTFSEGDTLDLEVTIDNDTGFDEFEVQVLVPNEAIWSSSYAMGAKLLLAPGSLLRRAFCNPAASNCTSLNTTSGTTTTITSGTSSTVTVPLTIPALDEGNYVVRIRVVNTDTGEIVGYYRNAVFSGHRVTLEVI